MPSLHTIKEVNLKSILSKNEKTFFYYFNNRKYNLHTNKINGFNFNNVDYIYLGIPNNQILKTLLKIVKLTDPSKINLLVDTPPVGLNNIFNISIFKKFKTCSVIEESPFTPEFLKINNLEEVKHIKKIEKIMYFHSGYMYHSFSQIKKLFKLNYFNFIHKNKTSRFTEEIKIYNGFNNIAVIYNPRDYSIGRYLITYSDGYINNYNLKIKNKDFNKSINIKHNHDNAFYYGFDILQDNEVISSYQTEFKYNLNSDESIQSQIHMILKEIGVRDYLIRLFEDKIYEYKKPYTIIESTYDYICTKLINKYGLFFDIKIPFLKKSIFLLFLEFFYNL